MKTRNKIIAALVLSGAAVAGTALVNRMIQLEAISNGILNKDKYQSFAYKLGNIAYKKSGTGPPLLLIHDLDCTACGSEWDRIVPELARDHTVYVPDLLGCGRSDKPNLTYTNYLYVSLLGAFAHSVIGEKPDVICSRGSIPLVIMTSRMNPDLFGKLIFVSPESTAENMRTPGRKELTYRKFLNMPVLGTSIYQIAVGRQPIAEKIAFRDFFSPYILPESVLETRYEASHLGASPKSLYASILCNFTRCDIRKPLQELKNQILLITGAADPNGNRNSESLFTWNHSITCVVIGKCKRFPQIEKPVDFLAEVRDFL